MKIHKEGYSTLGFIASTLLVINFLLHLFVSELKMVLLLVGVSSIVLFCFFLQFFRSPEREPVSDEDSVISPADGEIVAIEEIVEKEYFVNKRIQVSVFMSAFNVHINWIPISGIVEYFKYHPGKYLLARNPKSSELNERTSIVIKDKSGNEVLIRQVAGIVARRVVAYVKENEEVVQGKQIGYIKFGSRVDILLPLGSEICCSIGDKVTGSQTVIAKFC